MLKKKIAYTDYNGNDREETFYFNLSEAEIVDMQMSEDGGLAQTLARIVETKDVPQIISMFKKIILKAYGVKSDDGRRFIKSAQLSEEFAQTEAFSNLYISFLQNPEEGANFIKALMPARLAKAASELSGKSEGEIIEMIQSNPQA